jgi:peptidoglycan/xylan/chitin deacetylase (PgdA/CDA1 family)
VPFASVEAASLMLNPYKLAADLVAPLSDRLLQGTGSIFMLHRFADRDRGNGGLDPARVRADLAYLRRKRYELVSITELTARLRNRDRRLGKTVAFTVDDGYADFASVGVRVFAEHDCPVTVFVVTGVVDQASWYWWDRVQETMKQAKRRDLEVDIANERFVATLGTPELAHKAASDLTERLKRVSDVERRRVIAAVEDVLEVELSVHPPARFAPMTWDEITGCEQHGVTFGPHTITHPILTRLDDASARWEVEGSWLRMREQTRAAVPVFCYPNGGMTDFSQRELANLRLLGFDSAVTACGEYASVTRWHSSPDAPFLLPRFGYNGNPALFKQTVTGVLRARLAIRRGLGRSNDR